MNRLRSLVRLGRRQLLRGAAAAGALQLASPFVVPARSQPAPSRDGTLKIGVSSATTTLDPHFFHLTANMEVDKLVYSALVTQDAHMRVIPDLAVSWKALDDTHWQFKLREGVTFQDGTPFTPDDVVFTYQRARNVPNSPGSFQQFLKHVADVKVVDATTIVIETTQPDPILLNELMNVWIVSRKIGANATTHDYNSLKTAIGTGPYRVVKWVPGAQVTLERYDGYFGTKPEWKQVIQTAMVNDGARVSALLSGGVDMIGGVPTADVVLLKKRPDISFSTIEADRCFFIQLDVSRDNSPFVTDAEGRPMTKNPLKDVRVRQALSKAIDRDALVTRVMQNQAVAASQFMPDWVPGTSAKMKPVAYDLPGAKKLLADAGYPKGFGLMLDATNDRYINDSEVAQAVGQMFARAGLEMKVDAMPQALFFPRAVKRAFSASLEGNSSDTGEPLSQLEYLLSTFDAAKGMGLGNFGRYSDPHFDQLIDVASATLDDAKRNALLAAAYEYAIGEQYAVLPMYFPIDSWAMRKGLTYTGYPQEMTVASLVTTTS